MHNGSRYTLVGDWHVKVAAQKKLHVLDPDRVVEKQVKNPEHFVIVHAVKDNTKGASNTFLALKSSTLNKFAAELVTVLKISNLRVVFVEIDTNTDHFFDKIQELDKPGLVRKLFKVTSKDQINRILHAWCDKRAESSIASAYVENEEFVVQACDLKHYRIKFKDFVGLSELTQDQREHFEIDEFGHDIRWTKQNVSIDLDVVRYKVDREFKHAKDMDALADYKDYLSRAIRMVMSDHGLTQAQLRKKGGPSERHLYRIEHSELELTSNMIDRLAKAHGLASNDYIDELIEACDAITEEEADSV